MTEDAKKKKKKVVSSVTTGMGDPLLDIKQFNKELGDGYADITFTSTDEKTAVIIEIKQTDNKFQKFKVAKLALEQIEHKDYYQDYLDYDAVKNIYCFGICFSKKSCAVEFKNIKKN